MELGQRAHRHYDTELYWETTEANRIWKAKNTKIFTAWTLAIHCGGKDTKQSALLEDSSPELGSKETKWVQSVVSALLYYGRAIGATILPTLSSISISAQQVKPTVNVILNLNRLLDYVATFPNVRIKFYASNILLYIDSNTPYLCERKAKSRVPGFHYFRYNTSSKLQSPMNHSITGECKLLRHVASFTADTVVGGIFLNTQTGIIIKRILSDLGHSQPLFPLKIDNTTTASFVTNNIHQKRSKTWDIHFYWLRD